MAEANVEAALRGRIAAVEQADLYRFRRQVEADAGPVTQVDGRSVVVFCSNDYLGLATDPRIRRAAVHAVNEYGLGSGASQLVTGHHALHRALEDELADWLGRDRALLYSSGYLANIGVISSLIGQGDQVFSDALNHASLIDGMRLSRASVDVYPHADAVSARALMQSANAGSKHKRLLVTDTIFSMDGDAAPLSDLAQCCAEEEVWLMADDAHGLGVVGPSGAGAVAAQGLDQHQIPILTATLGKSLGSAGAFVAGSEALIDYLIQRSRTLIYSTAPPPALAAAALAAVKIARADDSSRQYLFELITRFREGAAQVGLELMPSQSAIQPLIVGAAKDAMQISQGLLESGYLVTAIRPPTVPAGTARLRVTLSAAHTVDQVDGLLDALSRVCAELAT